MTDDAAEPTPDTRFRDDAPSSAGVLLRERSRLRIVRPRPSRESAAAPLRGRLRYVLDGPGRANLLAATDACCAVVALLIAVMAAASGLPWLTSRPWLATYALLVLAALQVRGLYRGSLQVGVLDTVGRLAGAISVAAMLVLGLDVLFAGERASAIVVTYIWALSVALIIVARAVVGQLIRVARGRGLVAKPTLVVGAGVVGERIVRHLEDRPEYGLRPIGFLDADPLKNTEWFDGRHPVLGSPEDIAEVAEITSAEHVIFAFTKGPDHELVRLARQCERLGLGVLLVPRFFESSNSVELERVGSLPLVGLRAVDPQGWQFRLKYALDRVLALLLLLVAIPAMLVVAVAVKLSSPGPVLFGSAASAAMAWTSSCSSSARCGTNPSPRRSRSWPDSRRVGSRERTGARRSGSSCGARHSTSCRRLITSEGRDEPCGAAA